MCATNSAGSVELQKTMPSPVGTIAVCATPLGLTSVRFIDAATANEESPADQAASQDEQPRNAAPGASQALALVESAMQQLDEYFRGQRTEFNLPIDPGVLGEFFSDSFSGQVRSALSTIPYGDTWSYSEIAAAAGNKDASRAAGTACATNPLPIIVPCHRVLPASGRIGNYLGGTAAKEQLLKLESRARNQTGGGSV